jgi:hypothetical protein
MELEIVQEKSGHTLYVNSIPMFRSIGIDAICKDANNLKSGICQVIARGKYVSFIKFNGEYRIV